MNRHELTSSEHPQQALLDHAIGSLESQLALQRTTLQVNMDVPEEERWPEFIDRTRAKIADLEALLKLPDDDILLISLFAAEIANFTQQRTQSDPNVADKQAYDHLWDKIELLPEEARRHLEDILTPLIAVTNDFHEWLEHQDSGTTLETTDQPAQAPATITPLVMAGLTQPPELPEAQPTRIESREGYIRRKLEERPDQADTPRVTIATSDEIKSAIQQIRQQKTTCHVCELIEAIYSTPSLHPEDYYDFKQRLAILVENKVIRPVSSDGDIYDILLTRRTRHRRRGDSKSRILTDPDTATLEEKLHAAGIGSGGRQRRVVSVNHRTDGLSKQKRSRSS